MLLDTLVYIAVFVFDSIFLFMFQKIWLQIDKEKCNRRVNVLLNNQYYENVGINDSSSSNYHYLLFCVMGCVFLFPLIAMFALRYGIGTDYFSYQYIYEAIHDKTFLDYWKYHNMDCKYFYVEPGYYIINRLSITYRMLLWIIAILMFTLVLISLKEYIKKVNLTFSVFVFFSIQYINSLNVMRFAIALCFMLVAYHSLANNRIKMFLGMVILAATFHKSALFCLTIYFMKQFKRHKLNHFRDIILLLLIILFPLFSNMIFGFVGEITIFSRYFESTIYSASESIGSGITWTLHVIPPLIPLILFCRKEIFSESSSSTLFRVCILEIPFRMLGLYNTWYTRLARYSQICQVIFIPLIISKVKSKNKKIVLYLYYTIWFLFYFLYYAIVNDQGDSLPYTWIF